MRVRLSLFNNPFFWLGFAGTMTVFAGFNAAKKFDRECLLNYQAGVEHGKWVKALENELSAQGDLRPDGDGKDVAVETPGESPAEA